MAPNKGQTILSLFIMAVTSASIFGGAGLIVQTSLSSDHSTPRVITEAFRQLRNGNMQSIVYAEASIDAFATTRKPVCKRETSIIHYLESRGIPSTLPIRSRLAETFGMQNYRDTKEENDRFLQMIIAWENEPEATGCTSPEVRMFD